MNSSESTEVPNPWKDFFHVYIELAEAVLSETTHSSSSKEVEDFKIFLTKLKEGDVQDRWHRDIVHTVIAQFKGKSKAIIFQEPSYFDDELCLFPEVEGFDVAKLWKEHPLYRQGLWGWIEQIFIIGNVCLHPNRKDKFLQTVRQLRASKPGAPIDQGEEEEENLDEVIGGIAGMFGVDEQNPMYGMMTKLAGRMKTTMESTDNPMALLQQMMSGDMSVLGNLQEEFQSEIQQKIESGEMTEDELQKQRDGMVQNFGGMEGLMQMAGQLGLNTGAAQPQPPPKATQPKKRDVPKPSTKKNHPKTHPTTNSSSMAKAPKRQTEPK
jgi:hypothetical protein